MSKKDERYAIIVSIIVVIAFGIAGWYENYEPLPQPSLQQMVKSVDNNLIQ